MLLPNEKLSGSHFSKMGSQTRRSPSELLNQRLEDKPKNVILNKRIRTSVDENRADGQSISSVRKPMALGKDRDNIKNGGKGCNIVEEKIRRLPGGGETWDRKMKRKRSMGTVFSRSIDGEGELKRVKQLKLSNEPTLQSSDARGFRSGFSRSNSKLDVASLPASSNACTAAKNEQEKVSRDSIDGSNKERTVLKGNKFNVRDNNYSGGIYTLSKGKASRPPRTGPLMAGNSTSVTRSSQTLEAREQPSNVNKPHSVSGTINRKRSLPTGSSSHMDMAQWVGQRPQKISRTRRANVVSPVLSCDEVHTLLEGCSPSDVGTRMTSLTTSGALISKVAVNSIQQGRVKHENVSSPSRLSESEESGESKSKVKGLESNEADERAINNSYNISSSVLATKKKDGLRRQGRVSKGSSVLKIGISTMKEKVEICTLTKPIRNMKPASIKNGSKSGRPPLKKSSDRKAITRLGNPLTTDSPDIAGESDDNREELLAAANFASNASYIGCSSLFWKKLEPYFAPVNLEGIACSKQLVKSTEVDHRCLSQMLGLGSDALDGPAHAVNLLSQSPPSRERGRSILNQTDSKEISSVVDRQMDSEGNKVAPLYQRVLTALIIDDQTDEETVGDGNMSFLCERDDSPRVACFSQDVENQSSIRTEYGFNSDNISCHGNGTFTSGTNIHDHELDGFLQVDQGALHPETNRLPLLSENDGGGLMGMHRISCSSSVNSHFEQMSMEDKLLLELQSVGLYPEPVPDLADGDCEAIDQDIIQLQKGLFQQVNKKREYFMKLTQRVEEGREMEQQALEQVAMDKLVELAYKKKLATRGSTAARNGLSKVSRPVALAFMKRTLARCRKFEETGESCFLEPVFKDVLLAVPSHDNYAGSVAAVNIPLTLNSQQESAASGLFPCKEQDVLGNLDHPSDQDFPRTGPILNRGKKKELLLDDVGASASLRSASIQANCFMGGAKRKRSERKTKAKPKQKAAQVSTSGNGSLSKLTENTNSEHQLACGGSNELISIELGVANEFNGNQDLDFWSNIEEDDTLGLAIPMDDLCELNIGL